LISELKNIDTEVFLFLNGFHNSFWDFVMYWMSNKLIWVPLYALLIYLIIRKYKQKSIWILLFVALLIAASDQFSVFIKNWVERPRPCHDENIGQLVHLVKNHCGGSFGFFSSHASNSFALAVFLPAFLRNKIRYFTTIALLWATLVSYSRIYLGVHYPGDVLAGAIFGAGFGYLFAFLYRLFINKFSPEKP